MKQLRYLDLSSNEIYGQIPHWAGEIGGNHSLISLNLFYNFITGLQQFQCYGLEYLYLQSNLIEGPFPTSIYNMSNLRYLDMSNNRFGRLFPHCFGNIPSYLKMIDLGNNRFQGTIQNVYGDCGHLEGLIFKGNQLEGELPRSLSKCLSLSVIDLGNNHLNGTFPGEIPESLAGIKGFAVLHLSHNHLVGRIPDRTQFKTFDENSFQGNVGLCGYSLPKKCSEYTQKPQLEASEDQEEESGFTWEVVMLGYGCGTLLGL
nr:leucine-rich repeat-containing protein [Tanacetum cinerariifolium]